MASLKSDDSFDVSKSKISAGDIVLPRLVKIICLLKFQILFREFDQYFLQYCKFLHDKVNSGKGSPFTKILAVGKSKK